MTYARISPVAHAGAQAATGWEVSDTSRRSDLIASLRDDDNQAVVERVQDALDRPAPARC